MSWKRMSWKRTINTYDCFFLFMYDVWTGLDSLNKFIYFFEYSCSDRLKLFEHLCLNTYVQMSYIIFNHTFIYLFL